MPCPTCTHTLDGIGQAGELIYHQCPRCGTSVIACTDGGQTTRTWTPKLVERCRELAQAATPEELRTLHRLGILEAIHPPADRPAVPAPLFKGLTPELVELRKACEYGLTHGKTNMIVDLQPLWRLFHMAEA